MNEYSNNGLKLQTFKYHYIWIVYLHTITLWKFEKRNKEKITRKILYKINNDIFSVIKFMW